MHVLDLYSVHLCAVSSSPVYLFILIQYLLDVANTRKQTQKTEQTNIPKMKFVAFVCKTHMRFILCVWARRMNVAKRTHHMKQLIRWILYRICLAFGIIKQLNLIYTVSELISRLTRRRHYYAFSRVQIKFMGDSNEVSTIPSICLVMFMSSNHKSWLQNDEENSLKFIGKSNPPVIYSKRNTWNDSYFITTAFQ